MATKTRKATQATNATTRTIRRRNAPTGDMTDLERRFAVEYLGAAQFNLETAVDPTPATPAEALARSLCP